MGVYQWTEQPAYTYLFALIGVTTKIQYLLKFPTVLSWHRPHALARNSEPASQLVSTSSNEHALHRVTMVSIRSDAFNILTDKCTGNRPLGRHRCRWKDII